MYKLLIGWTIFFGSACALFADVTADPANHTPAHLQSRLVVISPNWAAQIPPTGRVNVPTFLTTLSPGQKIAFGVIAEGVDRDTLLDGVTASVHFSGSGAGKSEWRDLHPTAIRQIKAEGADRALSVLNAGGIGVQDRAKIEEATSLVTLAVFQPDWTAPATESVAEVEIRVTVSSPSSSRTLDPLTVKVRSAADWLKGPPLSREEMGRYMNRYHDEVIPGQLLLLLSAAASRGELNNSAAEAFFTLAYKERGEARSIAIHAFPSLDSATQKAVLLVFCRAGVDLKTVLPAIPADALALLKKVEPLKDPRELPHFKDPVSPSAVGGIGVIMDQCWAGWMVTGDASYLRALVGLLAGAPDYPVFQAWQESHGGPKGLNARVARGLAYQIAGWSIGSFQRSDPYVADWLIYWQKDPAFPDALKTELAALSTNPAFRRN